MPSMNSITKGTGNVFADIGLPDAETHLLKAELVRRIVVLIDAAKLTQAQAAERMDMTQPGVSKMLRGHPRRARKTQNAGIGLMDRRTHRVA